MSKRFDLLKEYLDERVAFFEREDFFKDDPLSIPRAMEHKKDIEIMGFWTAVLSWGQRKTIINSSLKLLELMEHQPYEFIRNSSDSEYSRFADFKHRTFNGTDAIAFLDFFKRIYKEFDSLEKVFIHQQHSEDLERGIENARDYFLDSDKCEPRSKKHFASPSVNSACKRINMFLRWMVRHDEGKGVDLGIWKNIGTYQLFCPLDIHVANSARALGLLKRPQNDWKSVIELTTNLRKLNPVDPIRYDIALFGLGVSATEIPKEFLVLK